MATQRLWRLPLAASALAALLLGCGGGGGAPAPYNPGALAQQPGAPQLTGNTAIDGQNWINYRRSLIGLAALTPNERISAAAQGHARYQSLNNSTTHNQLAGQPGFTGATLPDRLAAAGYQLSAPYAYGEVIAATSERSGFYQAEELIAAIYHRFVIFEPVFKEIGSGAATSGGGTTYFTCDFTANRGYGVGLGSGQLTVYPANLQTGVAPNFFSDNESPDPVPDRNEVGFPVSVHANIGSTITVQSFSLRPRGGSALPVRLLSRPTDSETPYSAAAIVPLTVLAPATSYDVSFSGQVDGVAVNRSWSFTTR